MLVNKLVNEIYFPSIESTRISQSHRKKSFTIAWQEMCTTQDGIKMDYLYWLFTICILLRTKSPHPSYFILFGVVIWMDKPGDEHTGNILSRIGVKVRKQKPYSCNQKSTHNLLVITNRNKNSIIMR